MKREQTPANLLHISISVLVLLSTYVAFYLFLDHPKSNFLWNLSIDANSYHDGIPNQYQFYPFTVFLVGFLKYFGISAKLGAGIISFLALSIILHLLLYFWDKQAWKLNHYLLLYSIGWIPQIYEPVFQLGDAYLAVAILFLVIVFFRFSSLIDLFWIPLCITLSFLSSLLGFAIGSGFFLVFLIFSILQKSKKNTAVFYKKKNTAFIVCVFIFVIWMIGVTIAIADSFFFLHFFQTTKYFFLSLFLIFLLTFVISFLMKSEKELGSIAASIIFFSLLCGLFYFSIRTGKQEQQQNVSKKITAIESLVKKNLIEKNQILYISNARIRGILKSNLTNLRVTNVNVQEMGDSDYLLVSGLWSSDQAILERRYFPRRRLEENPYLLGLDSETALLKKRLWMKIIKEEKTSAAAKAIQTELTKFDQNGLQQKWIQWIWSILL